METINNIIKSSANYAKFLFMMSIFCIGCNIIFLYGLSNKLSINILEFYTLQDYINKTIENFIIVAIFLLLVIYLYLTPVNITIIAFLFNKIKSNVFNIIIIILDRLFLIYTLYFILKLFIIDISKYVISDYYYHIMQYFSGEIAFSLESAIFLLFILLYFLLIIFKSIFIKTYNKLIEEFKTNIKYYYVKHLVIILIFSFIYAIGGVYGELIFYSKNKKINTITTINDTLKNVKILDVLENYFIYKDSTNNIIIQKKENISKIFIDYNNNNKLKGSFPK